MENRIKKYLLKLKEANKLKETNKKILFLLSYTVISYQYNCLMDKNEVSKYTQLNSFHLIQKKENRHYDQFSGKMSHYVVMTFFLCIST